MNTENVDYLFQVNVPDGNKTYRFETIDELKDWAYQELEAWGWMAKPLSDRGNPSVPYQHFHRTRQLHDACESFLKDPTNHNVKAAIEGYLAQYESGQSIHHASRTAKKTFAIRDRSGPIPACAFATLAIDPSNNIGQFQQAEAANAVAHHVLFESGIDATIQPTYDAHLKEIEERHNAEFGDIETRFDKTVLEAKNQLAKATTLLNTTTESISKIRRVSLGMSRRRRKGLALFFDELRGARDKHINDTTLRLQEFEDFYNTKISLEAPVTYYQGKRVTHRIFSVVYALLLFAFMGLVGWGIYESRHVGTQLLDPNFWKEAQWGFTAFMLVTIGIVVAIARTILRFVLSQMHLGNDAHERVVMTKTLLALRERDVLTNEQLSPIIERLASPTQDGIVKDDFSAVTLSDHVRSAMNR